MQGNKEESFVIPVIEESLQTSKKVVTTGVVRIDKLVREHQAVITEALDSETIDVERVPMNVIVERPPAIRTEGDVTVIPVVEEVLVTTKQLRLVEEVRITKRRATRQYEESTVLRSEEVRVNRQPSLNLNQAGGERLDRSVNQLGEENNV